MNYIDPAVIMALMLIVGLLYTVYDGVKSAAKPAPNRMSPRPSVTVIYNLMRLLIF